MKLTFLFSVLFLSGSSALNCTSDAPCVRFCCDDCTDVDIADVDGADKLNVNVKALKGRPCDAMYELEPLISTDDEWSLAENGDVSISGVVHTTNKYCLQKSDDLKSQWTMLICFPEYFPATQDTLYPVLILVSLPFLIATFVIYAWIEELRNLHGKCLMCYVLSVIILHIDFIFIQLGSLNVGFLCTFVGFVLYFFTFLNNFWLNVMTFDIFQTFSRNFKVSLDEHQRFKNYCIYAFSAPTVFTAILLVVEYSPIMAMERYKANIGLEYCAITNSQMEFFYYVLPLTIINVFSACFIVISAFNLYQRSSSENSSGYTRLDAEKDRFVMYLKLFGFMSVVWVFEIFSISFEHDFFIISDIIHCLQGFVVFVIFVLHKNTRKLLKARFCTSSNSVDLEQSDKEAEDDEGDFQRL